MIVIKRDDLTCVYPFADTEAEAFQTASIDIHEAGIFVRACFIKWDDIDKFRDAIDEIGIAQEDAEAGDTVPDFKVTALPKY